MPGIWKPKGGGGGGGGMKPAGNWPASCGTADKGSGGGRFPLAISPARLEKSAALRPGRPGIAGTPEIGNGGGGGGGGGNYGGQRRY